VGLVVAGVGALWVIFRGDLSKALAFEVGKGEALFFVGCFCQALYAPLVRLLNRGEGILEFTFWTLVGCSLCLTIFAIPDIVATDWLGFNAVVWVAIAYLAVFSTALTFLLLQFASLRLPAAKIFPYTYFVPSFVMLIEVVLGHGWPPLSLAAGTMVTLAGLVLLMAPSRRFPSGGQSR
jgi:drug/metabolite transporter (DMT)-like permease